MRPELRFIDFPDELPEGEYTVQSLGVTFEDERPIITYYYSGPAPPRAHQQTYPGEVCWCKEVHDY
jgi:hypothetical protein